MSFEKCTSGALRNAIRQGEFIALALLAAVRNWFQKDKAGTLSSPLSLFLSL